MRTYRLRKKIPMAEITLVQRTVEEYKVPTVRAIRVAQKEVLIRIKSIAVQFLIKKNIANTLE